MSELKRNKVYKVYLGRIFNFTSCN